jgi:hypothetical protein
MIRVYLAVGLLAARLYLERRAARVAHAPRHGLAVA